MPSTSAKQHVVITRFPFESVLSGEEWHTINLAEALRAKGALVSLLSDDQVLLKAFEERGFTCQKSWAGSLPVSKKNMILFLFQWPFALIRLLQDLKQLPAATHLYMLSLSEKLVLTPIAVLLGINVTWVEHQRFGKWIYLNPFRLLYWLWANMRFATVIGVSPMYEEGLKKLGVPDQNRRIITNGIDLNIFHPEVPLLSLQGEGLHIGVVARLSEDKGVDMLLRAFSVFVHKYTPATLHIVGEGPMKSALMQLAHDLDIALHTHFYEPYTTFSREDMPSFFRSLDVFVLPSRYFDPFGLVAAEALAVGTATIVTNVCGISSMLYHEKEAYIAEANDISSLTKGLLWINQNKHRAILEQQGPKIAKQWFDQNLMVEQYMLAMHLQSK